MGQIIQGRYGLAGEPPQTLAEVGVGLGLSAERAEQRRRLWQSLQSDFLASRPVAPAIAHDTIYRRALRTMHSKEAEAFDLTKEAAEVREAYGRGEFGQGCLIARRLIEREAAYSGRRRPDALSRR